MTHIYNNVAAMLVMAAIALTSCGGSEGGDNSASAGDSESMDYIDSLSYACGREIGARKNREFAALPPDQIRRISKEDYVSGVKAALSSDFTRKNVCDGIREGLKTAVNVDEWEHLGLPLNRSKVLEAYTRGYTDNSISEDAISQVNADYERIFSKVQNLLLEKRRADRRDQMAFERKLRNENIDAGKAYLQRIKQQYPDLVETKSGLFYRIEQSASGVRPRDNSAVRIIYEIKSIDGNVIDSSHGEDVDVDVNDMIAGLKEGLQLMPAGSKATFYVPASLGFGADTPGIEAGQMIIISIHLKEILS